MIISRRLSALYGFLAPCKKLGDVGCDHGYLSLMALDSDICNSVVISDISEKSLNKAINTLSRYMGTRAKAVVCDGLGNVDTDCDQVVIAGMGGEEIVKIILSAPFLPKTFVLQPMKNSSKVREVLIQKSYGITVDKTLLLDGKFYDFIVAVKGEIVPAYTSDELAWGRGNLRGEGDFTKFLDDKISRLGSSENNKNIKVKEKIKELKRLKDETKSTF